MDSKTGQLKVVSPEHGVIVNCPTIFSLGHGGPFVKRL